MARWFVAGAAGMLGQDLCAVLEAAGHTVTRADLPGLDILDPAQCAQQVAGHDVVVNSAAYTAVDAAETDEARAFARQRRRRGQPGPRGPRGRGRDGAALDRLRRRRRRPTEPYAADAPVAPATAYGRTKAAGEWAVRAECPRSWVVRTAWLYGAGGKNFPATMQRLAGERERLTVVADQVGQPTWTVDLAEGIVRIVDAGAPFGIWHATGAGECSWFELARAVFEELGLDPERVSPISTDGLPAAGATPGLQRAVARHVGRRGPGAAAALARRPAPRRTRRCSAADRPAPRGAAPRLDRVLKSIVGRAQAAVLPRTHHGTSPAGVKLPPTVYRMGGAHFRQDDAFVSSAVAEVGRLEERIGLSTLVAPARLGLRRRAPGRRHRREAGPDRPVPRRRHPEAPRRLGPAAPR